MKNKLITHNWRKTNHNMIALASLLAEKGISLATGTWDNQYYIYCQHKTILYNHKAEDYNVFEGTMEETTGEIIYLTNRLEEMVDYILSLTSTKYPTVVVVYNLKDALITFADAYLALTNVMYEFENEADLNDIIVEKYPFEKSFDELGIADWVINCIEKIEGGQK